MDSLILAAIAYFVAKNFIFKNEREDIPVRSVRLAIGVFFAHLFVLSSYFGLERPGYFELSSDYVNENVIVTVVDESDWTKGTFTVSLKKISGTYYLSNFRSVYDGSAWGNKRLSCIASSDLNVSNPFNKNAKKCQFPGSNKVYGVEF